MSAQQLQLNHNKKALNGAALQSSHRPGYVPIMRMADSISLFPSNTETLLSN